MLYLLCRCQLRHINHASINIATSILGGRWRHVIWRIRWSTARYWIILQLWRCVMWRTGWLLTNRGQLGWINGWILQWRRHRYHRWGKLIAILLTFLVIKALVITRSVLWRFGWLLTNRGQLRWIYDWTIQSRRHRYHRWWKLVSIWVNFLAIKAPVIKMSRSLPTLIVPCSASAVTINTLWEWHDECNMSLWWCCATVILFVGGHQKVRANFLARQLQSCSIFSTRNKIDYTLYIIIHLPLTFLYKLISLKSPKNWWRKYNSCGEDLAYLCFCGGGTLQNLTHN